jgi:hypothetical protein
MAISLKDLRTVRADKPPRVLLYGPPKIGKTTLASEFPNPVFVQVEDGTPGGVELTSWRVTTYPEVLEAIAALFSEHDYKTLVVDSLSALEPLVWAEVCRRNNWPSIEAPGYGKGYVEADLLWQEFMLAISTLRRERGMIVVLIAHSEIKRIEDPIVGPIDRYVIQMHKRAVDIIQKDADVIAFLNYRIAVSETKGAFNKTHRRGIGAGERIINFADRPGFMAGNRYSLPDEITYLRGEGYSSIADRLPGVNFETRTQQEAA